MAKKDTHQLAVAVISPTGGVEFVPSSDIRFSRLATAVTSQFAQTSLASHLSSSGFDSPFASLNTGSNIPYQQLLGGSPGLRQLLLPKPTDFDAIFNRIEFYRKNSSWVNRALVLRAAFNASEISVHAPRSEKQTEWMQGLVRQLRFFSFAREWFWQLRAFGQVITLWKTRPGGKKPVSIECADLRAHQARGPGAAPRIVVLPNKVAAITKLVQEARRGGEKGRAAQERLNEFPAPLVEAAGSSKTAEVDARDLESYGYYLSYTSLDRRHHEDWAFPGMYSIFGDIEMVEMARAVDINALHHYKAAILLVRLGPEDPTGNDIPVMATGPQLKALEKRLMEQARNRFPTLVARGDLRIDFVTPPVEVFTTEKYKMAVTNIFDWLGIPKSAWPGEDLQGAFASAQVTLKFLQQESKDERDLFREEFERLFHTWASSSSRFGEAQWPRIAFDPNSLTEPRLIYESARLLWEIGVSVDTVLDVLGFDGEVEATRLRDYDKILKELKVDFIPRGRTSRPQGRPTGTDQPTPERDTGNQQPRPGAAAAVEDLGLESEETEDTFEPTE